LSIVLSVYVGLLLCFDLSVQASVKIDIGFAKEAPILGIFGMNVYHKDRLIMVTSFPTCQQTSGYFSPFYHKDRLSAHLFYNYLKLYLLQ
jgi:hypothetical protein